MSDRDTAEELARMAAAMRGQKARFNRDLVESLHPAEEPKPEEDTETEQEFMARLFAPKPGHAEFVRRLHGTEGP